MKKSLLEATYTGDLTYQSEEQTLSNLDKRARICYRSEPKSTKPVNFIRALMGSGHGSTLEQSQLGVHVTEKEGINLIMGTLQCGRYRFLDLECFESDRIIAANLRFWVEAYDILDTADPRYTEIFGRIRYLMPTLLSHWRVDEIPHQHPDLPNPIRRHGAYIKCDRGVMAEVTRHDMNFLVESSRYVGYSGNIDGREMEVIDMLPHTMHCPDPDNEPKAYAIWHESCMHTAKSYNRLRELTKPEIARQVLNMSLATRWYMAGLPLYWKHFFKLRNSPKAQPICRSMAAKLEEEMAEHLGDA